MFLDFFGLSEDPFKITPNPRFVYCGTAFNQVRRTLYDAVSNDARLILLSGVAGVGKTLLLRLLLSDLKSTANARPIGFHCCAPEETADDLLGQAAADQHSSAILLIDEAQTLSRAELSRFLQIALKEQAARVVLSGQPDMERSLAESTFVDDVVVHRLESLAPLEVGFYIKTRLEAAGCKRATVFSQQSIERIALYSNGLPRLINILCSSALLAAFLDSNETVSGAIIDVVAKDCGLAMTANHETDLDAAVALNPNMEQSKLSEANRETTVPIPIPPRAIVAHNGGRRAALWGVAAICAAIGVLYTPRNNTINVQQLLQQRSETLALATQDMTDKEQERIVEIVQPAADTVEMPVDSALEPLIEPLISVETLSRQPEMEPPAVKQPIVEGGVIEQFVIERSVVEQSVIDYPAVDQAMLEQADNNSDSEQTAEGVVSESQNIVLESAVESQLAPEPEPTPAPSAPQEPEVRVFIHHTAAKSRDNQTAQRLARYLRESGFTVADIRAVKFRIGSGSVRYFFSSDKTASTELMQQLTRFFATDAGKKPSKIMDFTHYAAKPRPGTLEIWIPTT